MLCSLIPLNILYTLHFYHFMKSFYFDINSGLLPKKKKMYLLKTFMVVNPDGDFLDDIAGKL